MGSVLLVVWAVGALLTAASVLRNRVFSKGWLMNAAAIVLWPAYWILFLVSFLLGRAKT